MLIVPYTSDWIANFDKIRFELGTALRGIDYQIEHIGSTSVPGLAAKAIIDIDIIYKNEVDFQNLKAGLKKTGYYHNGDQGIPQREVFKRAGMRHNQILDNVPHHLYVCLANSKPLERHILFRNHLRKNKEARQSYETMKHQLAELANQNKKRYAELKELHVNDFIDAIIEMEENL